MGQEKFEGQDFPKILAALEKARSCGAPGSVTVRFDQSGGVTAIEREMKEKIK